MPLAGAREAAYTSRSDPERERPLRMTTAPAPSPAAEAHDLAISRVLAAPRAALWRAWTDPALLAQWWCPRPWTTEVRAFDLRPGGAFHTFMQGPDGGTSDNPGCFLDVVPQERIVTTSLMVGGWRPATSWLPSTVVVTFADEGAGTRYIATAMHPDRATRDRHEAMGFHVGWNLCIDQLEALARTLA